MHKIKLHKAGMNPFLKGFLYVLGALLILLIIIQLFLSFWADDYAANYLKDTVRESSNSTYTIDFDDLSLNVFSGSASINNLRIDTDTIAFARKTSPTSKPPKTLFQGHIGNLDISGINVYSAVMGNELSIGSITITDPNINRLHNPRELPKDSSSNFSSVDSSIYAAISKRYKALEIDEFAIKNGRTAALQSSDTLESLGELNVNLQNIRVDSASAQSGRLLPTKNVSLSAARYSRKMGDSLNTISFKNFSLSAEDQSILLDSLQLQPRYSRLAYSRKNGQRIDRISLTVPELSIKNVDFTSLIDSSRFYAPYAEINGTRFEDFLNKSARPGPKVNKPLPFTAFREMQQAIKIDTLRINDTYISYSEYLSKSPQAGTIAFEDLNATLYNLSNYQKDMQAGLTMELDVQTRVYGTGLLNVHFNFPMDTQNGFHTIKGTLQSMPISNFNRILKYIAFVRVDKGVLNSLEFDMTLNNNRSNGDAIMNYENLKISLLDANTMEQKGVKENIITFVANNFVVNKSNTPETGMQAGRIGFERIKHKSIFNYWWKSLLSGIKKSVK